MSQAAKATRDVSIAEAEAELAEDIYKRALDVVRSFEKKRMLRSRIVGSAKTGLWI